MDSLTERAIALLREDGRASFSDMARRLGTTRANIARRIAPMLESGQLRVVAAVHPRLLGLDTLAHLTVRAEGDISALAAEIAKLESPVFISEISGPSQLVVEVHRASLTELQEDLQHIRAMPGVLEIQMLLYERMLKSFFLGEEPTLFAHTLDEADLRIMELLQGDGRLGFAELAEHAQLSISGCRTRVNRLITAGVMKIGAILSRDSSGTGLPFGFGISLSGDDQQLIELIKSQDGVEFLGRTIGRFDIVATITFANLRDFNEFLASVRAVPSVRVAEQWLHARVPHERYHQSVHRIRYQVAAANADADAS
ncbi:Lrp/AsnC family transcriptional regulator [Ruicaihuangia caeni]|uniref:Lrp/AsnC family transcriptional regulator n=1 Tax=Ruicaihuangia caeni TaxID=3042517 RepID=A0AAW6TC58_9MICO|nr:Lrp/AsnC family transcriptional regulator [Klugiella sp. YN-L-19]MDI2099177.1 Lrp/AsnC family transcriptional regulator [Klugiella sp. YN-L-19]